MPISIIVTATYAIERLNRTSDDSARARGACVENSISFVASPSAPPGVSTLIARPLDCAASTRQYEIIRASGRMNAWIAAASMNSDASSSPRTSANHQPTFASMTWTSAQPCSRSMKYRATPPTTSMTTLKIVAAWLRSWGCSMDVSA
jgi:hypothetical protein